MVITAALLCFISSSMGVDPDFRSLSILVAVNGICFLPIFIFLPRDITTSDFTWAYQLVYLYFAFIIYFFTLIPKRYWMKRKAISRWLWTVGFISFLFVFHVYLRGFKRAFKFENLQYVLYLFFPIIGVIWKAGASYILSRKVSAGIQFVGMKQFFSRNV